MTDAQVTIHRHGAVSFVGKDAVNLYRAITLEQALRLYAKSGMLPTRGVSATSLLRMAGQYTGKSYKRGAHVMAADDVRIWVDTMKAAMPVSEAE